MALAAPDCVLHPDAGVGSTRPKNTAPDLLPESRKKVLFARMLLANGTTAEDTDRAGVRVAEEAFHDLDIILSGKNFGCFGTAFSRFNILFIDDTDPQNSSSRPVAWSTHAGADATRPITIHP